MIRSATRLAAPISVAMDLFWDTDRWPAWMPGVVAVRTLGETDDCRRVELVQRHFGRAFEQVLVCRRAGAAIRHDQERGQLRRWQASWRFAEADRDTTVLRLELDFDLGLLGLVAPGALTARFTERQVDETMSAAQGAARVLAGARTVAAAGPDAGDVVLQVFEIADGHELVGATTPAVGAAGADVMLQVFENANGLEVVIGGQAFAIRNRSAARR